MPHPADCWNGCGKGWDMSHTFEEEHDAGSVYECRRWEGAFGPIATWWLCPVFLSACYILPYEGVGCPLWMGTYSGGLCCWAGGMPSLIFDFRVHGRSLLICFPNECITYFILECEGAKFCCKKRCSACTCWCCQNWHHLSSREKNGRNFSSTYFVYAWKWFWQQLHLPSFSRCQSRNSDCLERPPGCCLG